MIGLEQLADGSVSDRNFQKLMSLVPDTGGLSVGVRFGADTVTWPGGQTLSTAKTVTHGLGTDPSLVLITPICTAGDGAGFTAQVLNVGGVSFDAKLSVDSFSPVAATTRNFYWLVIG